MNHEFGDEKASTRETVEMKRPYCPPKLIAYGDLSKLTLTKGSGARDSAMS
jgi:hypothetical protein